jgi:uncharacterized protein
VTRRTGDPSIEFELPRFEPPWWAPNPHAQTLAGKVLRRLEDRPLRTRRMELPDGDFVDLHEEPEPHPVGSPRVVLLHGLEGCSRANYVTTVARELVAHRIRPIRLNFRGCSGEMNRLARFYHAGDTGDLDYVLKALRDEEPEAPLGAMGFSLGGNVLLKYLGEAGETNPAEVACAVAVSVPFDLAAGARQLEGGGLGRFYTRYFLRKLRRKIRGKRHLLEAHVDTGRALQARSLREFDAVTTARLHGFRDASDYYERASSRPWLGNIRVPTLLLQALDDPFQPLSARPAEVLRENPYLVDGFSSGGGHVGFVRGTPWNPDFWAERQAARFLAAGLGAATSRAAPVNPDRHTCER